MLSKQTKEFKTHLETSVHSYLGEITCFNRFNESEDIVKAKKEVLNWFIEVLNKTEDIMNKG